MTDKVQLFESYGSVAYGQTDIQPQINGLPGPFDTSESPESYKGIAEISIVVNGDEPNVAFIQVLGNDRDRTIATWCKAAKLVAATDWWE